MSQSWNSIDYLRLQTALDLLIFDSTSHSINLSMFNRGRYKLISVTMLIDSSKPVILALEAIFG